MTDKKPTLASALLDAQRSIHAVGKDSKNNYSKYNYASAENIIAACREVLLEAGLTFQRTAWDMSEVSYRHVSNWDKNQKRMADTELAVAVVTMKFKLSHPASAESEEYAAAVHAQERVGTPLDKAVSAALTSGLSYMLRDILMIPRVDETELNQFDDSTYQDRLKSGQHPTPQQLEHKAFQSENLAIRSRVVPILTEAGVKKATQTDAIYRFVTNGKLGSDDVSNDNQAFAEVATALETYAKELRDAGVPLTELVDRALEAKQETAA